VIFPTIQETRTEVDFLQHIKQTVESDPQAKWIFIADQLNTHKSASLVEWIAKECNIQLTVRSFFRLLHQIALPDLDKW